MTYNKIEPFIKEYGVRKSFFVDYFKKQEQQGKTKNEIQAEASRLDSTLDFESIF